MTDTTDSSPTSSTTKKTRRKKSKFKYPVVVVIWDDAMSEASWQDEPKEDLEPTIATTIGFLIRDNPHEDRILVADSYIDDKQHTISGTTTIPRGMIQKVVILIKDGYKRA